MYPIRITLTSPEHQHRIKRMLMMGFFKHMCATLFIVLAIFSIFVLIAQVFLQSYFAEVALQSIQRRHPAGQINDRVLAINTTLSSAAHIQNEYYAWTPLLRLIAESIPSSITIDRMRLSRTAGTLELAGTAPSRDALLELQASLETLDQITSVPISLSDLTKHTDIHFSLSIPFAFSL